jgi:ATP-binding cassette subfamily C protein/ATP-binding cassette subfamily C exporter for protease/lipase
MASDMLRRNIQRFQQVSALTAVLKPHSGLAVRLIIFSGIINLMALSISIYMMQVYDRVLGSQSKDTLFFLTLAVMFAIILSACLEAVRQQVANRVGTWFAQTMSPILLARSLELRLTMPHMRLEVLRELNQVKNFLSTPTLFNVVDMLWVPLYLAVIFLLHPWFGVIATIGAVSLFGLTYFNERATRSSIRYTQSLASANLAYAESLVRNSEVIDAMGMSDRTIAHWSTGMMDETDAVDETQQRSVKFLAVTKFVRNAIQVLLLGCGALLILDLQLTGGAMIAGSIIVARLLSPIEASMSYWKQLVMARHSFARISQLCDIPRVRPSEMTLPRPAGAISVSRLTYVPAGMKGAILRSVDFQIAPGTLLAVVGPSASGKTTLSRMIVGVLKPSSGHVRLDGADTFEWKRSDFGQHVGYLPQDIELLPGTVRQNIARFRTDVSDEQVVAAAKLADCHEMILQLDNGYDCMLGDQALQLSGGQRQRIGLARALFGIPKLVVLDEPNSSLDTKGDAALASTLGKLKTQGVTTIVVSHRANLLRLADKILVMMDGRVTNFGHARDVIAQLGGEKPPAPARRIGGNGKAPVEAAPMVPEN